MTLLASFFLPSASLINMYIYIYIGQVKGECIFVGLQIDRKGL